MYEHLTLIDTRFSSRNNPWSWKKKTMSPASIGHGGKCDIKCYPFDRISTEAFTREKVTILRFLREPACSTKLLSF